jgi:hypothetical protein
MCAIRVCATNALPLATIARVRASVVPRPATLSLVRAVVVALLGLGCASSDVIATLRDGSVGVDVPLVDARLDAPDAPRVDGGFCAGSGPLFQVGDGVGEPRCGGTVTQTTFRFALCACDGFALSHALTVDAFDSREGPWTPGRRGGSVGSNQSFAASAGASIGGSVIAESDVDGAGLPIDVGGSVRAGGMLSGSAAFGIDKDLFAGAGVSVDRLRVDGLVHLPSGAPYDVRESEDVGGVVREPVAIDAPCDCDVSRLLDVGAVVEGYRDDNDDARAGLTPDSLGEGDDRRVELECGRYYFDRVAGGALELVIRGRVAIFVASDLALDGAFVVTLEGGAELDLFVAGNVLGTARWTIGDPARPSRVRFYVGGAGTVDLGAGGDLAANLYAPRAELVTPESLEVFGSVFVRRLAASGPLAVHYDEAILDVGGECPTPDGCDTCRDCGNQACVDGACGLCRGDADCCAPLVCAAGRCIPEPF